MSHKVIDGLERFHALRAGHYLVTEYLAVTPQSNGRPEGFHAQLAYERPFPSVNSLVIDKMILLIECLLAKITRVGLIFRVDNLVLVQRALLIECLGTEITIKRFFFDCLHCI